MLVDQINLWLLNRLSYSGDIMAPLPNRWLVRALYDLGFTTDITQALRAFEDPILVITNTKTGYNVYISTIEFNNISTVDEMIAFFIAEIHKEATELAQDTLL